ncbi:FAD-dependent oxidoreductase [Gordonia sp. SID5947]|uniref:NAD(P)/FAD-dependent oxidoreductase n=1 Tax=Gordonia sp. SID5947 TaxID=2690315 RepID=UPI00136B3FF9|nr:FAD-dependent oxidoreductase [Gordonia sp. SID5947]MYR07842.1 FAD-dependent oxidoreductase [Gordonia sp. SID5947]
MSQSPSRSVAVVGGGVSGLTAAHLLAGQHRVTLFESDHRLGGHAHTHDVTMPDGEVLSVDTGFIVHNDRTYPTLLRMFDELGVATQATDMSMSVRSESTGLEYAGALGVRGLVPTARTLTRGRYLLMLGEVIRFHRAARRLLDGTDSDEPLGEFVTREGFSDYFLENFLLPLVAAVWSCDDEVAAEYPARYLFTFLDHHGMLSVFGSPTWRTAVGGSARYVEKIADGVLGRGGTIHTGSPVESVTPVDGGVEITAGPTGTELFDAVVIATHPHQALTMLSDPTPAQRRALSAIRYSAKHAVLHTDTSLLPRAQRARASWNYQIRDDRPINRDVRTAATPAGLDGSGIAVTYDMTRLMRLPTTQPRMLVTLGRTDLVDESSVLAEMTYEHPVYTTESVAAQALMPEAETDVIRFAGAYHGWGFHEDGALSGARAAELIGASRRAVTTRVTPTAPVTS